MSRMSLLLHVLKIYSWMKGDARSRRTIRQVKSSVNSEPIDIYRNIFIGAERAKEVRSSRRKPDATGFKNIVISPYRQRIVSTIDLLTSQKRRCRLRKTLKIPGRSWRIPRARPSVRPLARAAMKRLLEILLLAASRNIATIRERNINFLGRLDSPRNRNEKQAERHRGSRRP